ncbi:hypothetical protein [Georgenia sp. SUBG003]|uniref:hypothetical protein n=1 Tax=Georgenia sp. SUBG003 TaxID=1497974 RepID=UPI0004D5E571|nr:hypothetical protein DA06_14825 [Georgenia sp. SUBG003]
MGQTPADQRGKGLPDGDPARAPGSAGDPLALLEGIADVPLAEQVPMFDAIHAHLSARLTSAEN